MKVFYAMPFTGKSYETILKERKKIHKLAKSLGLEIIEQFINIEEKRKFEDHDYGPLFIAEKDHNLLKLADLVIADYNSHSIGRDCEVVIAKEVFNKRIISIVKDYHMQNHPWVRIYSDYIVSNQKEAFQLAHKLSKFSLSSETHELSREKKDQLDTQIEDLLRQKNLNAAFELFPTELKRRWKALFGKEYKAVVEYSFEKLPTTLRINTLKENKMNFLKRAKNYSWKLKSLDFSPIAFRFLANSPEDFYELPEYKQGNFYIQELASMLSVIALNPKPGENILDIAAAPGSKTTQIAQLMRNKGKILANDISEERLEILNQAVERLGIKIVESNVGDGSKLGDIYKEKFDRVLVDAPCSNEGIIRYKPHKFFEWSLMQIYRQIKVQRNLIESGFKALKPRGTMVYSTCSYGPEENEAIVDYLLRKYPSADVEPIKLKGVKIRKGLQKWEHLNFDKRILNTIRIYPQDNDSIGFFIAKIAKRG